MKKLMKRIGAVLMAVAMMAALGVGSAFAQTDFADGDGTITVNNAAQGETYYAIKVLGAKASDDGIVYTGDIPAELANVLEVKAVAGTGNNSYQVIGKKDNVSNDDYVAALRAYATAQEANWGEGIQCTGNSVQFTGLDLGFYVIVSTLVDGDQSTLTNKVSAGSTFSDGDAPHTAIGVVYEKNSKTVTVTKSADEKYSIGDTVEYTVRYNGVNYIGTGENAEIVVKYEVKDTLPEFLSGASVTKIKIGDTEYEGDDLTEDAFPGVTSFGTNKQFDIPWAVGTKGNYTSKYANGTAIEITYQATVTNVIKVDGTDGNKNTVEITPYVDTNEDEPEPREEDWKADHEIFTYAAALKKVDEDGNVLTGAKFQFKGLELDATTGGVYTVVSYDPDASDYTDATEVEVGSDGMIYILGLGDVTLTGKETVAPNGYGLLTTEITLEPQVLEHEIWTEAGTRKFDADDNLVAETSTEDHTLEVSKTITDLDADAVLVTNKAGSSLPSTGGIGTYVFTVAGVAIMAIAAGLLIVRHKKKAE